MPKIVRQLFNPCFVLVIRLSRSGRKNQAAYRVVVAEHSAPVKSRYVEILGSYIPYEGKKLMVEKDRVKHWLSKGARPSETVASLLAKHGMDGMEPFFRARNKKRAEKNPDPEKAAPAVVADAAPAEEAPAEEVAAA